MNFEPATTLTEQIADHLGGQIISGLLKPQARIQELKVAGELGVSRGSVREALLILESRHLIEIVPRRGAVVSTLEGKEVANFCAIFIELQSMCFTELAALANADLDELEQALTAMQAAVRTEDAAGVLESRRRFQVGALHSLDNFYLGAILEGLIPVSMRVAHLVSAHPTYDARDTLRYHQALLEALSAREVVRVEELVRAFHGRERKLAAGCCEPAQNHKRGGSAIAGF